MAISEARDQGKMQGVLYKEAKVKELEKEIQTMKETQMRMEDKIYVLSIENKQRQDDKEVMMMLLPQILKALNGRQNNIKGLLSQLENEGLKNKIQKLL